MKQVIFQDLGLIDYKVCWDYQESIFQDIVQKKLYNRDKPIEQQKMINNHFLFCEHPPVYTLGKSGDMQHLLYSEKQLEENRIDFYKINRGGDITYHGPGQIVGYPIFDLDMFFTDISKYLNYLEEAIIRTLKEYAVEAGRIKGSTGVWLSPDEPVRARKIAAIGVKCSRWVTMHGFAFNINTDLSYFSHIIPCGITDKAVTSLQKETDQLLSVEEVKSKLKLHLAALFEIEWVKK